MKVCTTKLCHAFCFPCTFSMLPKHALFLGLQAGLSLAQILPNLKKEGGQICWHQGIDCSVIGMGTWICFCFGLFVVIWSRKELVLRYVVVYNYFQMGQKK